MLEKTFEIKKLMEYGTWVSTAVLCVLMIWMWMQGYFQDPAALQLMIEHAGFFGPLIFMLIQAFQVVVPIIPGGMTSVLGVMCFGPAFGFIYNYIGIVVGSVILFHLAKVYGKPLAMKLIPVKTYDKYIGWLNKGKKFDYFFAAAIFAPCAPDDVLCLLAGLTKMSYLKYILIILLGKPLALLAYSMSLTAMLSFL